MIEKAYRDILTGITHLDVSLLFASAPFPAVSYKVTPIQGGVVRSDQLEVRIIGDDYEELSKINRRIIEQLDMEGNKPSILIDRYAMRSSLSGGGTLYNDILGKWELYTIFITKWRKIHE
ncbi:MAG: hypothetical protein HFE82_06790 [Erysipelotrichaceae bacterium]|nr:hypothetical protein [Erysipelotrichaceae bacterium]